MLYFFTALAMAQPENSTCTDSSDSLTVYYKTIEEREAEIAAAEKEAAELAPKNARVLVMKWPKTSTSHTDGNLKLNIQSAINRADVTLLPVVDLYQGGRAVPMKSKDPTAWV